MEDGTKNNQDSKGGGKFNLPGDYFEKSAQSIFNKIEWEEEHKAYFQLLKWRNKHGFDLPEDYFQSKEAQLEQIEFPFLKDLSANPGFSVPTEYFELAEFQTYEQFKAEEQDELSSFRTLNSIPKRNSFYLPQEYFVSNEAHVNALLTSEPKTKIISLFRKSFAYSAAAILLVVISLWVYNYYFKPVEVKDCGTIACVDRMDLLKTKNLESLDNDQLYDLVNPSDLEKNLETDTKKEQPMNKLDSGLKDIPTEELLDEI